MNGKNYLIPLHVILLLLYYPLLLKATTNNLYVWGDFENSAIRHPEAFSWSSKPLPFNETVVFNSPIKQIATSLQHSVILTADGEVYTCGTSNLGQLGTGVMAESKLVPYKIPQSYFANLVIKQVSAGEYHSLALSDDGTKIFAWGHNGYGQLGDGTTVNKYVPIQTNVTTFGSNKVAMVSATLGSSFALADDGHVFSWGYNQDGYLGSGTTGPNVLLPAHVPIGGFATSQISSSYLHTMALTVGGQIYHWGACEYGCSPAATALDISALNSCRITSISAGAYRSFALCDDGSLYYYGDLLAQLDPGQYAYAFVSVDISSLTSAITTIAAGSYASDILTADGTWYSFGFGSYYSFDENDPNSFYSEVPVAVSAPDAFTTVFSCNHGYSTASFAITSDGEVISRGDNVQGQLGDGTQETISFPAPVMFMSASFGQVGTIKHISHFSHAVAVNDQNDVFTWGSGEQAQLGDGYISLRRVYPKKIKKRAMEGKNITHVSVGDTHTLVVTSDGKVYSWGDNTYAQLGDGTQILRKTPTEVVFPNGIQIQQAEAGAYASFALSTNGQLYAWGSNTVNIWGNLLGLLGDGTDNIRMTPVTINVGGKRVARVDAGRISACALTESGELYCWGHNLVGTLGIGVIGGVRKTPSLIPQSYFGNQAVMYMSCYLHCLVVTKIGTVFAWGWNPRGNIGDGSIATVAPNTPLYYYSPYHRTTPVAIQIPGKFISRVSAGYLASTALASDGTVYYWGQAIPQSATAHISTPQPVTRTVPYSETIKYTQVGEYDMSLVTEPIHCYSIQNNESSVCSGYGACVAQDWCHCISPVVTYPAYGSITDSHLGSQCEQHTVVHRLSDITSAVVLNDSMTYYVMSDITIQSGASLTVPPGVTIYMKENVRINIIGTLTAIGNQTHPITITPEVANTSWKSLRFLSSFSSTLQYLNIVGGGDASWAPLELHSSPIRLSNIEINSSAGAGVYFCECLPQISEITGSSLSNSVMIQESQCNLYAEIPSSNAPVVVS